MKLITFALFSALALAQQPISSPIAGGGGGGGGGASPAGSTGCVQLYATSTTFGCDTGLYNYIVANATGKTGLQVGPTEPDLSLYSGPSNSLSITHNGFTQGITVVTGSYEIDHFVSDFSGTIQSPVNMSGQASVQQDYYWAYHDDAYIQIGSQIFTYVPLANSPTTCCGHISWSVDSALGGPQLFMEMWPDLWRLTDPLNNTVGLTPSAAGFELNNGQPIFYGGSYLGMQMSNLQLLVDMVNPFIQTKNTQTATAPGAGKADMRWVAGTNAGTCKLVSNAGTSATEVTIVDNVGGGC